MNPSTRFFHLKPQGPFSLDSARSMQCGFLLGTRSCGLSDGSVRLAFPLDGDFQVVGVRLELRGNTLHAAVSGSGSLERIRAQVARLLGLDQDARPFQRALQAHPVLATLGAARPGFRPVMAPSPYVMAAWCVLSQRQSMVQAAAVQGRLSHACGDEIEIDGETVASFPRPGSLLARAGFPSISDEKWRRLQAVARAALEGELDAGRLCAEAPDAARERLRAIHGVGAWTADAILVRGSGVTDVLSESPMVRGAWAVAAGRDQPPGEREWRALAEAWRPFRTWVSVLLVSHDVDGARRAGKSAA